MARVYMVTDEEMMSLIEGLELVKHRKTNSLTAEDSVERNRISIAIEDAHRAYHFHVVRWVQAMGAPGIRR